MSDKPEPRFHVDLSIRVFGMGADSHPFSQEARAQNISDHGARISGLERRVKPGDIIGVQFGDQKARCKVIWVLNAGPVQKIQVGVRIMQGQFSPWQKERERQHAAAATPLARAAPAAKNKRKYPRHRIAFAIEIRDGQSVGSHLQTKTADIAGKGCYVETMLPLPLRRILNVTFWLNSERIETTAIVRTSDGGVGMGIEFIGLDEATQNRLQEMVEGLAAAAAPFTRAHGAK